MATNEAVPDRLPLDRARIGAAAHQIIAEVGVENLTMRAVAARLDVSAMALYHHVDDKDELLCIVGDDILAQIDLPESDAGDWREQFTTVSLAAVDALLEVPGLSSVLMSSTMLPNARRLVRFCIRQFTRGGMDREAARELYAGVQTLVLGRLLIEENANFRTSAGPHPDDDVHDYIVTLRARSSFISALTVLVERPPATN